MRILTRCLDFMFAKVELNIVPVIIRVFLGTIWLGIQAYWGGQAARVTIGAMIPGEN